MFYVWHWSSIVLLCERPYTFRIPTGKTRKLSSKTILRRWRHCTCRIVIRWTLQLLSVLDWSMGVIHFAQFLTLKLDCFIMWETLVLTKPNWENPELFDSKSNLYIIWKWYYCWQTKKKWIREANGALVIKLMLLSLTSNSVGESESGFFHQTRKALIGSPQPRIWKALIHCLNKSFFANQLLKLLFFVNHLLILMFSRRLVVTRCSSRFSKTTSSTLL